MPKDAEYLPALRLLGTAAQALADRDAAAQVYEALRPHAHRWVIDGIFAGCLGLGAHSLGRLAAMLGRGKAALGWLEQAREAHRAADASLLLAETEGALAELSVRSGQSAMAGAGSAAGSQLASPVAESRRSGRVWLLHWDGSAVTVADSKGMRDLAVLLAAPDREVPVLELVEAAGGPPAVAAGGHAGERLDRAARTGRLCAYRPERPVRWRLS